MMTVAILLPSMKTFQSKCSLLCMTIVFILIFFLVYDSFLLFWTMKICWSKCSLFFAPPVFTLIRFQGFKVMTAFPCRFSHVPMHEVTFSSVDEPKLLCKVRCARIIYDQRVIFFIWKYHNIWIYTGFLCSYLHCSQTLDWT
jgi:hypothetical protein